MPESWTIRDCSWAPTTNTVPVDNVGPQGFGKCAILVKRPVGKFSDDCFEFVTRPIPETVDDGNVLVQNLYMSMDPTNLIWAQEIPQYMPAVGLGTVMRCLTIGRIVKSSDEEKFPVGKIVTTFGGVAEYCLFPFAAVNPVVPDVPITWNVGPFSLIQGHTAWVGYKICSPKPGETFVVSGAAGAVGSTAGQLAKRAGARVIGIAGGAEKCRTVVEEFGFDGCIDYKAESIADGLRRLCPQGVDCYFDNVGGECLDAVLAAANCFGRIAFCGAVSSYQGNMGENASGPRNYEMILMRRLTVQGFICVDHLASVPESFAEIGEAIKEGKLKQKEDIREVDIENYVEVVNNLFTGGNNGKLILRLPASVSSGL